MPATTIEHAQFVAAPDVTPPADSAAWEDTALPDYWSLRRPTFRGNGWYRFRVSLEEMPKDGIGLYIAISRTQTELYVNGRYAGASGIIEGPAPDRIGYTQLYAMPAAALRTGENVVHLRVFRPGAGGGLSEIKVGPYSPLYFEWMKQMFYYFATYALVGVGVTIIGVFVLALWVQRRRHAEYFYFGAGSLAWGLHSLFRLLPGQRFPLHYTTIWHFSNLLSVALLTIFCLRFAQRRWRWFERLVWACTFALLPVFYAAAALGPGDVGYLPGVTDVVHQVYNVFILVALVGVVLHVREGGGIDRWLLLLGAASFSAPRLITWLGLGPNEQARLDSLSLTPGAIFAFVFIACWILVERFVRTAREFETLNAQLELRVAEKSRELREQLRATEAAREEAEKANLAKSRFLAAASHDLRQPLHALGLFAEALNERTRDAADRDLVAHINQSIGGLGVLFNGVLDVSKLDAGAVSPNIGNVALQRVFERIGDEFWPEADARLLRLRLVPTRHIVRTDPVLLERILRNLVQNAIRYTNQGGVLVGARRQGNRVRVEVRDTGIGIAPEDQGRIFDEFYQVGNPERDRNQGLGLGLAIVKRLSDLLGHPLSVRSTPGRGSVFSLTMDLADAAVDAAPAEEPDPTGRDTDMLRDRCIAIIDDDRAVREGMLALLASWHSDAVVAADEAEAVATLVATGRTPALLIVDYRLRSGAIGTDVIHSLRTRFGRDIPAVIISGASSAEELARIEASGLPLLHKPVPAAKLRSLLFYLLARPAAAGRSVDHPAAAT